MDWSWVLGDAAFYFRMALEAIAYVLVIATTFYGIERVLMKYGLWDPTPPTKRVKRSH